MTRPERRAEKEAAFEAEQKDQWEREAACIHWSCDVVTSDWEGRPKLVRCRDCDGEHEIFHGD